MSSQLTSDMLREYLPSILSHLPYEWRGTTFANSKLLGRAGFVDNITELVLRKEASRSVGNGGVPTISEEELVLAGNAEDYMRVATNISTLLEMVLALDAGLPINQVFTFASQAMSVLSILLTTQPRAVHLFVEQGLDLPFSETDLAFFNLLGCNLVIHAAGELPCSQGDGVVVSWQRGWLMKGQADAVATSNSLLYIHNTDKISPAEILVIRKRLGTPLTTPVCERMLQELAGFEHLSADNDQASSEQVSGFLAHLQTMSGTTADATCEPVVCTAGLPAICAIWMSLLQHGGADVLMASTAYGGSSQLTDIIAKLAPTQFAKSTFDITGKNDISLAIETALQSLVSSAKQPFTVLFVEIPTNPDMKVPDMARLAQLLTAYQKQSNKRVLLLVDTTFAPASQVMKLMSDVAPELTTMVFLSMSKSVSRGYTTAGALVANTASQESCALLQTARDAARVFDTIAKKDQMFRLATNHVGVEDRCQRAYHVAAQVGSALVDVVAQVSNGYEMELAFPTPAQAALGFSSSTFSFNLPPQKDATFEQNEALAQKYVDLLTEHKSFKPCVSFGQDNGLVYCTVPATSTQGAIKAEDKAKQAVGGVQLTRLSFPPVDVDALNTITQHVVNSIKKLYA